MPTPEVIVKLGYVVFLVGLFVLPIIVERGFYLNARRRKTARIRSAIFAINGLLAMGAGFILIITKNAPI